MRDSPRAQWRHASVEQFDQRATATPIFVTFEQFEMSAGRLVEHHGVGEVIVAKPGYVAQRKRLIHPQVVD